MADFGSDQARKSTESAFVEAKEARKEEEDAAEQKEGSRAALPPVIHKPKRPSDFTVYTGYLELECSP